jgi:cytoplasmic iron level regulating protein YaaA (DUF328/UPF0246 family)
MYIHIYTYLYINIYIYTYIYIHLYIKGDLSQESQCALKSLAQTAVSLLNIHYKLNPTPTKSTTNSTINPIVSTKNSISNTKNTIASVKEFIGDVYRDINKDSYSHSNGEFIKQACNLCKSVIIT